MKTSEIVVGETYRTSGHDTVIVLAHGYKNVTGYVGRWGRVDHYIPGGPKDTMIAVAKRSSSFYRGEEQPTWEPRLLRAQQILMTLAEYERLETERRRQDAEQLAIKQARSNEATALRYRMEQVTDGLVFRGEEGHISIGLKELRRLVELAEDGAFYRVARNAGTLVAAS